jgi:alpha-beta hydrolase superfamily lysophospholipase
MKRSASVDNLAFATAVAVASRTLIFRARLLGKVNKSLPEDLLRLKISRCPIASGKRILDAVFVAPADEPARASVLLCHGIGETVDHWFGVQKLLAGQGVASLVFDYSGFGRSTGGIRWKQCEQDAIEAFGALQLLLPDSPVSILGFSLGSGIAASVLDRISAQKLILCSSFTSFQDAACCAGLPRRLCFLPPPIWNTAQILGRCSLPVLVLHCENDRLFPRQMASELASSCKACVALVIVPDHEHNDPVYRPRRQYWDHVVSILVSDHGTRQSMPDWFARSR